MIGGSGNWELLFIAFSAISSLFLISSVYDIKQRKVPNWLCLLFLIFSCFYHIINFENSDWLQAIINFGLVFLILFPLFVFRIIGAGDVKLVMVFSTMINYQLLIQTIIYSIFFALFISFIMVIKSVGGNGIKQTARRYYQCLYLRMYIKPQQGEAAMIRIPFAPALALGWFMVCSKNDDVLWVINNIFSSL